MRGKKLVELKTKIRALSDVKRLESIDEVEALENMVDEMKTKVKELNKEMEDSWDQIKGDIDSSQKKINEAFGKLNRSLV